MSTIPPTTLIVTGTDTGVGKTVFSAALTGALGARYWKPVQAGPDEYEGTDALRVAFDECQFVLVSNHDAGTKAPVGLAELQRTEVNTMIFPLGPDSRAFEFTLNARLRYEA